MVVAPNDERARTLMRRLGAVVLAATTALVLTWPLARHPTTHLLDDGTLDGFQFTWNLWWVRTALVEGRNPFFTRALFYPGGVGLFWHTLAAPAGALSLPFALVGDGLRTAVLAQNALGLFATVATGLGGAALAAEVSGSTGAGAIAGLCLVANPFHLRHLHTANIASLYWLPVALLLWRRLHAGRRSRTGLGLVGCVLILLLAAHEYAVMALALLAYDLVWRILAARRGDEPLWLAGGAGTLALAAVAAAGIVTGLGRPAPAPPPYRMVLWGSAYLTGLVTPPWLLEPRSFMGPGLYLGTVALALAAAGQMLVPRTATRWNVAALLCVLAALGPVLQLRAPAPDFYRDPAAASPWPGWPLPYGAAYALVPALTIGRTPWRWVAAARVCLVVAAACGAAALAGRLERAPRLRVVAAAVLVGLTIAEAWPYRLAVVPAPLPAGYELLAGRPPEGAVLELPSGLRPGSLGLYSSLYMAYQTAHHRPLLEGTVARLPADRRLICERPDFQVAGQRGIAYAILHRPLFREVYPPGPSRRLAREVRRTGALVFRSRELRIYRLRVEASPTPVRQ